MHIAICLLALAAAATAGPTLNQKQCLDAKCSGNAVGDHRAHGIGDATRGSAILIELSNLPTPYPPTTTILPGTCRTYAVPLNMCIPAENNL